MSGEKNANYHCYNSVVVLRSDFNPIKRDLTSSTSSGVHVEGSTTAAIAIAVIAVGVACLLRCSSGNLSLPSWKWPRTNQRFGPMAVEDNM